ncbi:MAG TPA: BON domain-containing protein [Terriglobales bacterium]|nr:BON domain-containing protein [Terriglobales bacterium]
MKSRGRTYIPVLVILTMGLAIGCSRGRTDAQIVADVQARLFADPAVTTKQIQVSAENGTVTLTGTVASEMERAAAANSAAQVAGVKTVVNNLTVAQAAVSATIPVEAPAQVEPAAPARPRASSRSTAARSSVPAAAPAAPVQPVSAPAQPAAPRTPEPVTLDAGTTLEIRLIDSIDSERNQLGDVIRATLEHPLVYGDRVVVPKGAEVEGRIVEAKSAGRFKGRSEIALELTRLIVNGRSYAIQTDQFTREGSSRGKRTAATIGGGAALGAIIGGLAGGGKGAAIGAAVGAGAGTGVQAATKGEQIRIPSETVMTFHLQNSLTVTPVGRIERSATESTEYNE